jgi:NADP-dependent aldehyde dehydrogenase
VRPVNPPTSGRHDDDPVPACVDEAASRAAAAAPALAAQDPGSLAHALAAAADALTAARDELVPLAVAETGLGEPRLHAELTRTVVQLRLFAEVVLDGRHLDLRVDEADADFLLGPRPDLRRMMVPLGPVVNFAAGNFPFAFSVAGGDTAAALAARCPVVVKAHPGHPRLSERTAQIVGRALSAAGLPAGTLQLVAGDEAGLALLRDPRIRAATFTGSVRVGTYLAGVAAARPRPIPFYGELSSVNPVFVTRAAYAADAAGLAAGYVASVSGSAGQLCTKPGFLLLPSLEGLRAPLTEALSGVAESRMLSPRITAGFAERRTTVLETPGVEVLAEGSLRLDEHGNGWATPTVVATSTAALRAAGDALLDEAFGPLSVIAVYEDETELADLVPRLFDGQLTGTVHCAPGEDTPALRSLVAALTEGCGRLLFNGWPTGVAVTPAQQHGGPWPSTTSGGTSVGTAAIERFLRGVAYQDAPGHLLPPALRGTQGWAAPVTVSPAGRSASWGSLTGI